MKLSKSAILIFSMSAAILIGGLVGCSEVRTSEAAPPEAVSGVELVIARKTAVMDLLEVTGTVRAKQTSQIASQMMGTMMEIRVREGDRVQAGQVLATLDDSQPRAALEQADAAVTAAQKEAVAADSNFALAEATLKRYQQLFEKKSVSPQEFDEVKARYQTAEARREVARAGLKQSDSALAQARTSLGYSKVRAPFSGVITEKRVDLGALAAPGMPLFTIEDTRNFRLEAAVDESDISMVHAAQTVLVVVDALGNAELSGKVAQIVPAADPASRTFLVKIDLPANKGVRSGLFGRARFSRGERFAILIPESAVVTRGQLQGIYVLDESGVAGLRYVTLGRSSGKQIEVFSGLQEGEKVIAIPGNRDFSGRRVSTHP
ncbi:MAG TPA: efflux RND transporter periplasmic adaptor subunit [Candidatus Acidoferrum sp.]|nr:efflux RND transporter periplasmic adaptor subunit [Candidatus Acidoferrum sp.]